ncbi:Sll7028 protein [hydrothermal vent metagenome]|uniref:Sll7028 protein n=1 Tax=hydrothermal vent metagenome TaxID=652676 RepID=A0A1W1E9E5_9ZZZZ
MITAQEKLAKAKAKLMLEHPYIGALATTLKSVDDPKALTFSSDGMRLTYNPEYFEKVPLEEIEFALANGAMHAVLKHRERISDRVGRIWQAATDLVVNSMLVKNGFVLPPYVYYDERFEGMYAEEIYDVLKDEMITNQTRDDAEVQSEELEPTEEENKSASDNTSQNQSNEQSRSSHEPTKSEPLLVQEQPIDPETLETLQEELQEHFEQIFAKYKRQGELPKGLEIVVPELFLHKIDWREMLYRYIADYAKSSYSFMPPNMKYLYRGICLPSLSSDLLRIVIAIDTSGSIDQEMIGLFLSEVSAIMQQYPNYEIDIITADAKVQSHKTYLPGEPLAYEVSGGGGTDFRPVFEYIEREISYPTLLLYFTDGMGTFPMQEPGYDLVWVMSEAKEVPFGEVLMLEN